MRLATILACLWLLAGIAAADTGNAWHIPAGSEPGIATMRGPVQHATAAADVTIYSGNQFQGSGNPGNQLEQGSAVIYRHATDASWTTVPMKFFAQAGNNKYYKAAIPGSALRSGDVLEYYLRIAYSDHSTTFIYGGDATSTVTLDEARARATPFAFGVEWPLAPAGSYASHTDGDWQARVYMDSGHIALGYAGGEIVLAPPQVKLDGNWLPIGRVIAQTPIANGIDLQQAFGHRTIVARVTFKSPGVLRYEVIDWGGPAPSETQISGASNAGEHFYGFGEKFNALDQAGKVVRVVTSDTAGDKGDHSYLVAPWFISSRGYGVHLDSTAESVFDMRAGLADRFTARLVFGTFALNLVGGPTPRDVLSRYTGYAGRAPLPPPWVFGPWLSSDAWRDGGEVRYVVTRALAEAIPGSVFVFDSPWEIAYNDLRWNTTQFAAGGTYDGTYYPGFSSYAEMMTFLRTHGFKVVVWLTPFLNVRSNDEGIAGQNLGRAADYDYAAANGYLVRQSPNGAPLVVTWWKGDGSAVDFTNSAARSWFQAKLQGLVDESGGVIGGFKTDDGEADYIPLTASYADGRTGIEMRNGYCVEYLDAVHSVLGSDGIVFARSGFTGTTAFPAVWAGDNEPNFGTGNGLPSVMQAGLSAAMSGYAIWGSDIGGYQDRNASSAPEDLFMRWTQFGALTPIMQIHRQITAGKQYPWSYGQVALDNYREYARLHTALFPYLYTYAKQAAADGIPLMRPLALVGDSAEAQANADEFWLGGELLVAPVLDKATLTRAVYLPPGTWFDYFTHARHPGAQTITWTGASAAQMPLFVRAGAIVPRISPDVQSLADTAYVANPAIRTPDSSLDFLVYPSGTSKLDVYDGTELTSEVGDGKVTLTLSSAARAVDFQIYATATPKSVHVDGVELAAEHWSFDGRFVYVHIAHAGGASQLVVTGLGDSADDRSDGQPGAGCGCASSGTDVTPWLLVLVALARPRRRRRHATP